MKVSINQYLILSAVLVGSLNVITCHADSGKPLTTDDNIINVDDNADDAGDNNIGDAGDISDDMDISHSTQVLSDSKSMWIVRSGLLWSHPSNDSSRMSGGKNAIADFGYNSRIEGSNEVGAGLSLTITPAAHLGIELFITSPIQHTLKFEDGLIDGHKLGTVDLFSAVLTAQYYFNEPGDSFRPYIGAGINYSVFHKPEISSERTELDKLSIRDTWGLTEQIGLDYYLSPNWLINASLTYEDVDTEVQFYIPINTVSPKREIKTDFNPWLFRVNLGYFF